MGPEHTMWWPWAGFWIFPMIMFIMFIIIVCLFAGRRWGCWFPWSDSGRCDGECDGEGGISESALDILKKRYAKGEITKDEFEQMKKDILS